MFLCETSQPRYYSDTIGANNKNNAIKENMYTQGIRRDHSILQGQDDQNGQDGQGRNRWKRRLFNTEVTRAQTANSLRGSLLGQQ